MQRKKMIAADCILLYHKMTWHTIGTLYEEVVLPPGKYWIGDISHISTWNDQYSSGFYQDNSENYMICKKINVGQTYVGSNGFEYPCEKTLGIISACFATSDDPNGELGTFVNSGKNVFFSVEDSVVRITYSGRRKINIPFLEE